MPPQPSEAPQVLPMQSGVQQTLVPRHSAPLGQPGQLPPQPSPVLQACPPPAVVQEGVQQLWVPLEEMHSPTLQLPLQLPPQPSEAPQALPLQLGVQQLPLSQTALPVHRHCPPQPSPWLHSWAPPGPVQLGVQHW